MAFSISLSIYRGAYTKSTVELLKYSENLFELFKMSATLYSRLNNEKKRELLKLLCSNFSYDGENVVIIIKKASEPIVQIANLEKMDLDIQLNTQNHGNSLRTWILSMSKKYSFL